MDEMLGKLRTEKASIHLKLDRKEFKSANEGKKLLEKVDSQIEAARASIERLNAEMEFSQGRLELLKRIPESA